MYLVTCEFVCRYLRCIQQLLLYVIDQPDQNAQRGSTRQEYNTNKQISSYNILI